MAGRATVPEAARANARLFQAAAFRSTDPGGADSTGPEAAVALLALDRRQRAERVDERLATEDEDALLSLCG